MLTIRLRRKGKKNQPFFRVVVIDKRRSASGGNAVEVLGNVDPLTKKKNFKIERILYWISKGAKPTATVHNMLVSEKIIDAKKIAKKSKKPSAKAQASVAAASATTPATVEVKKENKPAEAPKEEAKPTEGEKSRSQSDRGSSTAELSGPVDQPKEPAQNPSDIKVGEEPKV